MHTLETIFFILALMSSIPVIVMHILQWCHGYCKVHADQAIPVFVFWIATAVIHYLRS